MIADPGQLGEHGANEFSPLGDVDVEKFFNGETEALLVHHHRNVVQTIEVWERLRRQELGGEKSNHQSPQTSPALGF